MCYKEHVLSATNGKYAQQAIYINTNVVVSEFVKDKAFHSNHDIVGVKLRGEGADLFSVV